MKIDKFDNTKTLFFVSGMFAGGWIWQETHPNIPNAAHCFVMDDPLCKLGASVDELSIKIIEELEKINHPVTLVGNSLGSFICLNIASQVPDKVDKVIISGSAGFGEVILPIKISNHNYYTVAQQFVELITFDKKRRTEQVTQKLAESFKHYARNIARLMRESNQLRAENLLPKIQCPVYAIWGRDDIITPLAETLEVINHFNIQLTIINQCGHSPMFEKPHEFAALVNYCLD